MTGSDAAPMPPRMQVPQINKTAAAQSDAVSGRRTDPPASMRAGAENAAFIPA